jgi:acyl-CoA synthetase (AMP-forming)/AMP-acid ligase II
MTIAVDSASIADVLWHRARHTPNRRAYLFLDERGCEQDERSYASLARRARAIARALLAVAEPGDRAALLFNPGMPFLDAFFGCLYAGVIAGPLMDAELDRPPACIAVDEIVDDADGRDSDPPPIRTDPDDLAFLQYTSGSTSLPKGVMVSNGNLRANARMIGAAMQQDENSNFVGWAPLYHDQGLIGNVLQPLHLGAPAALMAPNTFLQRPYLWLAAIAKYRAHTSGGPDFAFGLIADRFDAEAHRDLDLSCWKVAFNGAEPIRPAVLDRFALTLAPLGFSCGAIYPCYGLAEATLFTTGATAGCGAVTQVFDRAGLERGRLCAAAAGARLASSGKAAPGVALAIVDPATRVPQPEGAVGEVWVAAPSVARGYWRQPEATSATFGAFALDGTGPYLRTGDLGAVIEGELFVCGRLKDLIIVRGRNLYPQDLEATARRAHPAVSQGSAVAVAIPIEDAERLLLAVEINRTARHATDPAEISAAIRRAIRDEYDVMVDRLVLLTPGGIPKTTSGKVRRQAVAQAYRAGELAVWRVDGRYAPIESAQEA